MPRPELVPVTSADRARLAELARAFHVEDGHPLDAAGLAAVGEVCDGHPLARGWLIRVDGETVGYVVLTLGYGVQFGGVDGFLDDLYLVPAARGHGIGAAVMRLVEAEARRLGLKALHLVVAPGNRHAQRLYRRQGFQDSDWLFMSRPLTGPGPRPVLPAKGEADATAATAPPSPSGRRPPG